MFRSQSESSLIQGLSESTEKLLDTHDSYNLSKKSANDPSRFPFQTNTRKLFGKKESFSGGLTMPKYKAGYESCLHFIAQKNKEMPHKKSKNKPTVAPKPTIAVIKSQAISHNPFPEPEQEFSSINLAKQNKQKQQHINNISEQREQVLQQRIDSAQNEFEISEIDGVGGLIQQFENISRNEKCGGYVDELKRRFEKNSTVQGEIIVEKNPIYSPNRISTKIKEGAKRSVSKDRNDEFNKHHDKAEQHNDELTVSRMSDEEVAKCNEMHDEIAKECGERRRKESGSKTPPLSLDSLKEYWNGKFLKESRIQKMQRKFEIASKSSKSDLKTAEAKTRGCNLICSTSQNFKLMIMALREFCLKKADLKFTIKFADNIDDAENYTLFSFTKDDLDYLNNAGSVEFKSPIKVTGHHSDTSSYVDNPYIVVCELTGRDRKRIAKRYHALLKEDGQIQSQDELEDTDSELYVGSTSNKSIFEKYNLSKILKTKKLKRVSKDDLGRQFDALDSVNIRTGRNEPALKNIKTKTRSVSETIYDPNSEKPDQRSRMFVKKAEQEQLVQKSLADRKSIALTNSQIKREKHRPLPQRFSRCNHCLIGSDEVHEIICNFNTAMFSKIRPLMPNQLDNSEIIAFVNVGGHDFNPVEFFNAVLTLNNVEYEKLFSHGIRFQYPIHLMGDGLVDILSNPKPENPYSYGAGGLLTSRVVVRNKICKTYGMRRALSFDFVTHQMFRYDGCLPSEFEEHRDTNLVTMETFSFLDEKNYIRVSGDPESADERLQKDRDVYVSYRIYLDDYIRSCFFMQNTPFLPLRSSKNDVEFMKWKKSQFHLENETNMKIGDFLNTVGSFDADIKASCPLIRKRIPTQANLDAVHNFRCKRGYTITYRANGKTMELPTFYNIREHRQLICNLIDEAQSIPLKEYVAERYVENNSDNMIQGLLGKDWNTEETTQGDLYLDADAKYQVNEVNEADAKDKRDEIEVMQKDSSPKSSISYGAREYEGTKSGLNQWRIENFGEDVAESIAAGNVNNYLHPISLKEKDDLLLEDDHFPADDVLFENDPSSCDPAVDEDVTLGDVIVGGKNYDYYQSVTGNQFVEVSNAKFYQSPQEIDKDCSMAINEFDQNLDDVEDNEDLLKILNDLDQNLDELEKNKDEDLNIAYEMSQNIQQKAGKFSVVIKEECKKAEMKKPIAPPLDKLVTVQISAQPVILRKKNKCNNACSQLESEQLASIKSGNRNVTVLIAHDATHIRIGATNKTMFIHSSDSDSNPLEQLVDVQISAQEEIFGQKTKCNNCAQLESEQLDLITVSNRNTTVLMATDAEHIQSRATRGTLLASGSGSNPQSLFSEPQTNAHLTNKSENVAL